jgi:mannose-6-phosphate isomerase-like protein (cupin superfamily)
MTGTQSEVARKTGAVVRRGEGRTVRWGPAGTIRIVAGAESTDGSFSLCEVTEPPGSAAPLHVHHAEAEAFYVLDGACEVTCGDETSRADAGDFVYAPRGVAHKYIVVGNRPVRLLMLFSRPGFERFFVEAGMPTDTPPAGQPDPARLRRIVEKYQMELLEAPGH